MGRAARLFVRLAGLIGPTLQRFGLVRDQLHFLGNYSLSIISVSGLFVGFVLGLQGYYTLQRYGSAQALGLLVALSLVREPGLSFPRCCSRAARAPRSLRRSASCARASSSRPWR